MWPILCLEGSIEHRLILDEALDGTVADAAEQWAVLSVLQLSYSKRSKIILQPRKIKMS